MPQYDIYVSCNKCGSVHPMGIGIHVDTGPADEQSIDEAYERISLPPQIQAIEDHKTLCLKTGQWFVQKDLKEIFLKPREAITRTIPKQEEAGWPPREYRGPV
jgi:hypothetical protein